MTPAKIQVDVFEVQLGAGMLLQFKTEDGDTIRVLADGGVQASGYPPDHVQKKLPEAMKIFDAGSSRIDLIIGTHYDADHLDGLVPIIGDRTREIGEAWMPPVANDTQPHPEDEDPAEHRFLAIQFSREEGDKLLREYLTAKRAVCEQLKHLEDTALFSHQEMTVRAGTDRLVTKEYATLEGEEFRSGARQYFAAHIRDVGKRNGDEAGSNHADAAIDSPSMDRITEMVRNSELSDHRQSVLEHDRISALV